MYQTEPIGFHAGTELRNGEASNASYEAAVQLANNPDPAVVVNDTQAAYFDTGAIDPYERMYSNVVYP